MPYYDDGPWLPPVRAAWLLETGNVEESVRLSSEVILLRSANRIIVELPPDEPYPTPARALEMAKQFLPNAERGFPLSEVLARLLEHISTGRVKVMAKLSPNGRPDLIPSAEFYGMEFSGELSQNAWNPKMRGMGFYDLLVCGQDVLAEREKAVAPADEQEAGIYHTGLPGRPSSRHLIEAECCRRYKAGERHTSESAAEWARVLLAWLQSAHPDAPPPTQHTISVHLSPLLRQLQTNSPK